MRPVRSISAEAALNDTLTAFSDGVGPLAAWGADELRLDDGTTLVVGIRRSSDGGQLLGCWRIHHLEKSGIIASYDLDARGLRPVETE